MPNFANRLDLKSKERSDSFQSRKDRATRTCSAKYTDLAHLAHEGVPAPHCLTLLFELPPPPPPPLKATPYLVPVAVEINGGGFCPVVGLVLARLIVAEYRFPADQSTLFAPALPEVACVVTFTGDDKSGTVRGRPFCPRPVLVYDMAGSSSSSSSSSAGAGSGKECKPGDDMFILGRRIGVYECVIGLSMDPPVLCRRTGEVGAREVGEDGGMYELNLRGEVGGDFVGDIPGTSSRCGRFACRKSLGPKFLT